MRRSYSSLSEDSSETSSYPSSEEKGGWRGAIWSCLKGCGQCCWIFCCPPCPCEMIRKVAFQPPPPTYHFLTEDNKTKIKKPTPSTRNLFPLRIRIHKDVLETFGGIVEIMPKQMEEIDCFFAHTSRGNWIACLHYSCPVPPGDLGYLVLARLIPLAILLQCNVCAYDYSGYGLSTGRCSEKNMYSDIRAVYNVLINRYKQTPKQIILMGQSLGTAASVDLAKDIKHLAGVVLIAPFTSALNVVDHSSHGKIRKTLRRCDQFNSLQKIRETEAPVLVIHGVKDEIVPFAHGVTLYKNSKNTVPPLWISAASHNDVNEFPAVWTRLQKFVARDLKGGDLHSERYSEVIKRWVREEIHNMKKKSYTSSNSLDHLYRTETGESDSEKERNESFILAIVMGTSPKDLLRVCESAADNDGSSTSRKTLLSFSTGTKTSSTAC